MLATADNGVRLRRTSQTQWIWTIFMWFLLFAFLMVLFACFSDLLRDDELSGWAKGVWVIFLILLMPIAVLVYLIARGKGMQRRSAEQVRAYEAAQAEYIRAPRAPQDPLRLPSN